MSNRESDGDGYAENTPHDELKPVVYTAIPKWFVYANPIVGAYVENHGFAATTPWQYDYGMGERVNYDDLIESLDTLAVKADEVWVFGPRSGLFPYEDESRLGLGLTDGVVREIELAEEHGTPVRYIEFEPEEHEFEPIYPAFPPEPGDEWKVVSLAE